MRKYIVPASVLLVVFWSALLFSQPKKITIEEISKNSQSFSSQAVEVEGIVTQYVPSTSSTTSYYMINGEYGGSVKVNTFSTAPELFKRYRVTGTVYIDPVSREAFISERSRSSLEPASTSAPVEGTDPLVILLVVLFVLLAAIFIYTQISKHRERNLEEVIYALPVTPVGEAMNMPEARQPEKPVAEKYEPPQAKPRMEPIIEKPSPRIEMPPRMERPPRMEKPSRVEMPPADKKNQAPFFDSDFRTIKIVPAAPQTITFIPGVLEIISGDDAGKSFRIAGFPTAEGSIVSIGREVVTGERAYAHIQLNEKFRTVSRRQAELIYKDHKLFVRNLSETNLTQVDGVELKPGECAELKPEAKIRTGELEFQYKIN
ncbi:MAG: FHA domain-containing protein [Acidobacteriota bacterium]